MSTMRRLAAIPVLGVALTFAAFGVVRGASSPGPAHGVRLIVAIEPPVDDAARTMAAHVAHERLAEAGLPVRVIPNGQQLVAEVGTDDPDLVRRFSELLERTATLELHAVDARDPTLGVPPDRMLAYGHVGGAQSKRPYVLQREVLLDGKAIRHAEVFNGGVAVEVNEPAQLARVAPGVIVAFLLDGSVRMVGAPDRVVGRELHVPTMASTEDATIASALDLVAVIEAGAVRPLHVRSQEPFSRATGFLPRAWPFFAIAAVFSLAALVLLRRR